MRKHTAPTAPAGTVRVPAIERRDEFDGRLIARLRKCGRRLSRRLQLEITSYGARGVQPLCGILGARGWAPIHAVRLIEDMGAEGAIGEFIQALRETEDRDPLHEEIHRVLRGLGERVVEPMFLAHATFRDERVQDCVAEVLAGAGVRDDRILELLRGMLETGDVILAAGLLAEYGDPAALPALSRALDEATIEAPAPVTRTRALLEIAGAIQVLGGRLTPEQAATVEGARIPPWHPLPPPPPPPPVALRRPDRPGRNDPCWCGSGRKYKRCHLGEDASDATA
jgi:hypothetical protein